MRLRKICCALFLLSLFAAGAERARAQAAPAAYARTFSVSAGGMGSAFQPDYGGRFAADGEPVAGGAPNYLFGFGAYVDAHFNRWLEVEAEGRWLRLNQFIDIDQSNYLLGYEHHFDRRTFFRMTSYAKVLVGYGKMNFAYNEAHGSFTDLAYGGGLDLHMGKFTIRPVDFEYQQWPWWVSSQLNPYGFSAGIAYRVWGR